MTWQLKTSLDYIYLVENLTHLEKEKWFIKVNTSFIFLL
ncbi:hypothetical protein YPD27_3141 [Yersinia pestis KIM D27]|nr:hypothetical protein YPD27_3141 [Yersinia pestis KIM D27]